MLDKLPRDLLAHVMTFMDQDDLLAMSSTASWLRDAVRTEPLAWRSVCVRRPGCTSALEFLKSVATKCMSLTIASDDPDDIAWLLHGIRKQVPDSLVDTMYMKASCKSARDIPPNFLHFPLAFPRLVAMRADFHIASEDDVEGVDIQLPRNPACASSLRVLVVRDVAQRRRRRVGVFFQGAQESMTMLNVARLDVRESDFLFRASRRSLPSLRVLEYRADDDDHFLTRFAGSRLKTVDVAITDATHTRRLFRQLAHLKHARDITVRIGVRTVVVPMMARTMKHVVLNMSAQTQIVVLNFSRDDDENDDARLLPPQKVVLKSSSPGCRHVVKISDHDISRITIENVHPSAISVVAVIS